MSSDRIMSSGPEGPDEQEFELSLRPKWLREYIGQQKAKENLSIFIQAARKRGEALDHVLLYGPPGLGKCITGDSLVLTDRGMVKLCDLIPSELEPGQYAPCKVWVYGRGGIEPTSHVYNDGRRATIRLRTRSGFELEGTPNHPVLVATPGGPQWKPLGELTEADYVAIARGTEVWGEPQEIKFQPEYLNGASRKAMADQKVMALHECLTAALHRPPTAYELAWAYVGDYKQNPTPKIAALRLGLPLSDGRKYVPQRVLDLSDYELPRAKWPTPEILDGDLAYLMGLLVGDGHFERGMNSPAFNITVSEPEIQREIQRICHEKFNWIPKVKKYGDQAPQIRFGQNFGHLMIHLGVRAVLAGERVIPESILAGSAMVAKGFLQGLFDADGHAWRVGYVDFTSKSEILVKQVQVLLANFGVISHRSAKLVREQKYWQLFIGGRDVEIFYGRIGFRLTRKQERANGLKRFQRGANRSEAVPFAHVALAKLFQASRPHTHALHKRFDHVRSGDRVLSRSQIESYLSLLPDSVRLLPETSVLSELCDPHIYWDRIGALENGEAEVFDFSVPGTHSFVANGFFNHNTTLAHITANEMGSEIKTTAGPVIEKAGDLAALLTNLSEGDVLFIDEIHRLNPAIEEVLYPAMEDYQLDIIIGQGPSARSIKLELPRFTLVGATTRAGLISAPLRGRFGIPLHLDFYPASDLEIIVNRSADILGITIEESGAREIARRSRGTPRIANRLLRRVRDIAEVLYDGRITDVVAADALNRMEVDTYGLDEIDRKLLLTIIDKFDGGPVGLGTLSASISEEKDAIEEIYEPYLIQIGFLNRTPRGRTTTRAAYEHFGFKFRPPRPSTDQGSLFEDS